MSSNRHHVRQFRHMAPPGMLPPYGQMKVQHTRT